MKKNNLIDWCKENNKEYLLDEWDYERNKSELGLDISDVTYGAHKRTWWKCEKGHSWKTAISNRVNGNNCPFCSNQKILIGYNDLESWCINNGKERLLEDWNSEKNIILPSEIVFGSGKKVWWKCDKGHEWEALVYNRVKKGVGCPVCANQKILIGYNCLSTTHPELVEEWHPSKNGNLKPTDVTAGSNKKIWWLCKEKHEWKASVNSRTGTSKSNCPVCAGKKVQKGYNDLATVNLELAKEWDVEKNRELLGLEVTEVTIGSNKYAYWVCKDNPKHKWKSKVNNRKYRGCPFCNHQTSFPEQYLYYVLKTKFKKVENRKKIEGLEYDIYIKDIKLLIEYDGYYYHRVMSNRIKKEEEKENKTKENGYYFIKVKEVNTPLNKIEEIGNVIYVEERPSIEILNNVIVKIINFVNLQFNLCISKDVPEDSENKTKENIAKEEHKNSLGVRYPEISKEWHPTKNGDLKPSQYKAMSNDKVWWKCKNGHEWKAKICSRTGNNQTGCPFCSGRCSIVGCNDLKTTHPELAMEFDINKNKITLDSIKAGTNKKVWWKCDKGHSFYTSVDKRTNGGGCPYCSNHKVLENYNDLETTHPKLAKQWHPTLNGDLKPTDVTYGSSKKVWWRDELGHEWKTSINKRSNGSGCPYCSGHKIWVGFNDLQTTHPDIIKKWHPVKNGEISPTYLSRGSHIMVWWLCENGHSFKKRVYDMVRNQSCSICKK